MAKNNIFKSNINFDEFSVAVIKLIDSVRAASKDSDTTIESRINAFYRILGLPAIILEERNKKIELLERTIAKQTGNITIEPTVDVEVETKAIPGFSSDRIEMLKQEINRNPNDPKSIKAREILKARGLF